MGKRVAMKNLINHLDDENAGILTENEYHNLEVAIGSSGNRPKNTWCCEKNRFSPLNRKVPTFQ